MTPSAIADTILEKTMDPWLSIPIFRTNGFNLYKKNFCGIAYKLALDSLLVGVVTTVTILIGVFILSQL